MGIRGQSFDLHELKDYLLEPLHAAGVLVEEPQNQFAVYTVIRLGAEVDFGTARKRAKFDPLLSALAQVEESNHASAVAGDRAVPSVRLNAKHLAAASPLGAVHLVADQHDPPFGYDLARVQSMRDKYFIAFLLTMFQRLFFQRSKDDAANIGVRPATVEADEGLDSASVAAVAHGRVGRRRHSTQHDQLHGDRSDSVPKLTRLREEIFRFAITGQFPSISARESVNRFYRTCQRAFGVSQASTSLRQAVSDIESAETARRLEQGVQSMVDTQDKVEWVEIFIFSVYAVEMAKYLGESFDFNGTFVGYSLLVIAVAAVVGIGRLLAPHKHRRITWRGVRFGIWLIGLLLAFLLIGWKVPK